MPRADRMTNTKPIIFSSSMVRSIRCGNKTQTRRVIKSQPTESGPCQVICPYGEVGELLWVRENWRVGAWDENGALVCVDYLSGGFSNYLQTPEDYDFEKLWIQSCDDAEKAGLKTDADGQYSWEKGASPCRKRPSIFMPRWASRLSLKITGLRAERVQEISDDDAIAEGMFFTDYGKDKFGNQLEGWSFQKTKRWEQCLGSARFAFGNLWNSINGKRGAGWNGNPWVWVIEFEVINHD